MSAICIASGPSITEDDIQKCRMYPGRKIYVVNDVYKLAPWADVLYACDGTWWDHHNGVQGFKGARWTTNDEAARRWGLNHMPGTSQGLFHTQPPMCYGKNSGFQAINLAYLHGHRDIWLLGYDLGHDSGEQKHFFGEHPRAIDRPSQYADWLEHYRKAAPVMEAAGLNIINMTRRTFLDCFERSSL